MQAPNWCLYAQLNPIVYIPPTVLVLAIIGILSFRYLDAIQFQWQDLRSRLRSRGAGNGDPGLEEHRGEDEQDELLLDLEYDENGEPILPEEGGGHHQGGGAQVEPQGSATSARLRMHHEMVQQMRARAGFAPEPFPGDVEDGQGEGDGDEDEEDEEGEDDGGAGSSTGVRGTPTTAARIKRIGKKKAERLQRREQMRAYHEFMEMQRAERRQQEEMFKMQDAAQQEERQRKRAEQLEKDRKRKEQLKQKEAKDTESRLKRIQAERLKEEKARRDLRSYIQYCTSNLFSVKRDRAHIVISNVVIIGIVETSSLSAA
ncbi:hypothetical protein BGZ68_008600 [Mortierella alpina]|nr:hypothetical protein BGZ68_008600 [Mortierella alpina]